MRACGDAQHRVVRGVEVRIAELRGIGRHKRQVTRVRELDQRLLRGVAYRAAAARQFDVEPVGKERLQPVAHRARQLVPPVGKQPSERPFARAAQGDQTVSAPFEITEMNVRLELERPGEVRAADEIAQVRVPVLVLREQRKVIDDLAARVPRDAEQRADDGLDALLEASGGKGHRAVEPVAVANRDGGKAALLGDARDLLGIDRPLEQRVARHDAQGDERSVGHCN